MGQIRTPSPVKLFVGILTSLPDLLPEVEQRLNVAFGPVDSRSRLYPFDLTHYYDDEMGSPILRQFVTFQSLISPSGLAEVKEATQQIEADFAGQEPPVRRPVNLDPGYLEESKIVLASTKNFYHRILLSGGIYGEVTLHFAGGAWHPFPWTFPDYRSGRYDDFLLRLRQLYREQRRLSQEGRSRENER